MAELPVPHNSLSTYMVEINKIPLLSAEEEKDLAVRYREEGDVEAVHTLVTSNLRFVVKVANEYSSYGVRMADLIQEGNIGLMIAVKKFDPHKGCRLISYAVWWIRAMIQNYILKTWSLVKIGTTQAQRKLFNKLAQTKRALANFRDTSLDQPIHEESSTTALDLLTSPDNQEETLARAEETLKLQGEIAKALVNLNDKERFIVEKRLMTDDPMTLQEIGDHYQISRERARQLEERAKNKIRCALTDPNKGDVSRSGIAQELVALPAKGFS